MGTGHPYPSRWYTPYKFLKIREAIAAPFDPNRLPTAYGQWLDERIIEYPWFLSRLPAGPGKLLDAGSVFNFDFALHHPKIQQKELTIMTLAPESDCFWKQSVSYVFGDLRQTCFKDNYFDWIVSISTIEHIGLDNTVHYTSDPSRKESAPGSYITAIAELRRILRPGGTLYLTLPFGKATVLGWLQIFDQQMVDSIINAFAPGSHTAEFFRYSETKGWEHSTSSAAADAGYFDPSAGQPWKGGPMAAEAIVCLELRK